MAQKKLTRSSNKILAGVCGGIAEYFSVDPTLIRVCYAALSVLSAAFPGLILYIIMMLIMPENDPNDRFEDAQEVK
jgi:phage shock protein PspC (stress-responsive transcriptional regulator)